MTRDDVIRLRAKLDTYLAASGERLDTAALYRDLLAVAEGVRPQMCRSADDTLRLAADWLPPAEAQIVAYVAVGLLLGVQRFGPLHASKRDWLKEAAEEARDHAIYLLADDMDRAGMLPRWEE